MKPYELGQKLQVASYKSHQIQWQTVQQFGKFVANITLVIQLNSRLLYQIMSS